MILAVLSGAIVGAALAVIVIAFADDAAEAIAAWKRDRLRRRARLELPGTRVVRIGGRR